MIYETIKHLTNISCCSGVFLNALLLYIVCRYSNNLGPFKYLLIGMCSIEIGFAFLMLLVQPAYYAVEHRLLLLSHNVWFKPKTSSILSGLYCTFFFYWLGFVVIIFVYKYITLCREALFFKIRTRLWPKLVILVIYLVHIAYGLLCGVLWCENKIPKRMIEKIKKVYNVGLDGDEFYGYIVVSFLNKNDQFHFPGFLTVFDHFSVIIGSFAIISYCGWNIWNKIMEMQNVQSNADHRRNLQIFYTLVLQAAVPFVLYQIPTAVFLGDAIIEEEPILINIIPMWSLIMSLPKVIDPIVILLIIRDYREALARMIFAPLKGNRVAQHQMNTFSTSQATSSTARTVFCDNT